MCSGQLSLLSCMGWSDRHQLSSYLVEKQCWIGGHMCCVMNWHVERCYIEVTQEGDSSLQCYCLIAEWEVAERSMICVRLHFLGRSYIVTWGLMLLLCLFPFCFLIFLYFPLFWTTDQDKNLGKDDPYLEWIVAKFQRDSWRGFGGRGILRHL